MDKIAIVFDYGSEAIAEERLFETVLGIEAPWYESETCFEDAAHTLTIRVDFHRGSRLGHPEAAGRHPVLDTQTKHYRYLTFFQQECFLEVCVPRVKLPDGSVRRISPPWTGKLAGFSLFFEALVLWLYRKMGLATGPGGGQELAINETSRVRGHAYGTIAADAKRREAIFVTQTREAQAIKRLATDLSAHTGDPAAIRAVSIYMSPAYIKGVGRHMPNAAVTCDRLHVIAYASHALDFTRRDDQNHNPVL